METHEYVLWITVIAYAIHAFEEKMLNWRSWAFKALKLDLDWAHFYTANFTAIISAVACAMIGWKLPIMGLLIPGLMLVNGIFFHILPTLIQRRFSPGVITAVFLFIPVSSYCYYAAYLDGVLTWSIGIGSIIVGWVLMALPFIFMKIKKHLKN